MAHDMRVRQLDRDPGPAAKFPEDRIKIHAADRKSLAFHFGKLREVSRKLVDGLKRDGDDLPSVFSFWIMPLKNVHRDVASTEVNVGLVIDSRNLGHPGASVPQKKIDQKIPASSPGIVRRSLIIENLELRCKVVELLFVQVVDPLLGDQRYKRRRIRL